MGDFLRLSVDWPVCLRRHTFCQQRQSGGIRGRRGWSAEALQPLCPFRPLCYFESRGIGRDEAENILARAAIERLARAVGDRETEDAILQELSEVL